MKDEYIIVNKTGICKRITKLKAKNNLNTSKREWVYEKGQEYALKRILSQSIPLIPEIEKAFDSGCAYTVQSQIHQYLVPKFNPFGFRNHEDMVQIHPDKQEYINNLKLEI